jgi:hypothetical protein
MKQIFLLLILGLLISVANSQEQNLGITHYLFPEFTKGVILMKTGLKNEASLNYNSLTEEMIFENKGVKLAFGQLEQVDTVYILKRKFIPVNGKFLELILHSSSDLYAEHKCELKDPGTPAGYGGTSQTSATTTYSQILSGGQAYDLKLPESIETNPYVVYWVKKDGKLSKFSSLNQLSKIFDDKSTEYKKYTKEHRVAFNNQQSLIDLVQYLGSN